MSAAPYRDFAYPLNVLMHVLMLEEGAVGALHYGLFEDPTEQIGLAQARSTALLMSRLPPLPARVLDVGIGLGTTLHALTMAGYAAVGITPEASQVALAGERYGDVVSAHCARFEDLDSSFGPFDLVLFQESSQYIDSSRLFATACALTLRVLVLDEFSLRPAEPPHALHSRANFLDAAARAGFELVEEMDLSIQAAPTVDYFLERFPRHGDALRQTVGVTEQQLAELIESGHRYRRHYADGTYGYRLMDLRCAR
jgi:SAM-dependent methyltransferase